MLSNGATSESLLQSSLKFFCGSSTKQWRPTLRALFLDLPGWAGMFSRMQAHPSEAPAGVPVRVADFAAVLSILMRSSVESLAASAGWDASAQPFVAFLSRVHTQRRHARQIPGQGARATSLQNPSALAFLNQNSLRREALESEYSHLTLCAIGLLGEPTKERVALQVSGRCSDFR